MRRTLWPLATLGLLCVIVAGCGNGAAGTGSSNATGGTKSTDVTLEKAVKFAECMRANGVSAFPDPGASGSFTIDGVVNGSSLDPNSAAFEQALSACKDLEPPGFTGTTVTSAAEDGTPRVRPVRARKRGVGLPRPHPKRAACRHESNPIRVNSGWHEHAQRSDAEVRPVLLRGRCTEEPVMRKAAAVVLAAAAAADRRCRRHPRCRASDRGSRRACPPRMADSR